jgi:hypothetical protein
MMVVMKEWKSIKQAGAIANLMGKTEQSNNWMRAPRRILVRILSVSRRMNWISGVSRYAHKGF